MDESRLSKETIQEITKQTNLNENQIKKWILNKRKTKWYNLERLKIMEKNNRQYFE